jgi:hypothetical protein
LPPGTPVTDGGTPAADRPDTTASATDGTGTEPGGVLAWLLRLAVGILRFLGLL